MTPLGPMSSLGDGGSLRPGQLTITPVQPRQVEEGCIPHCSCLAMASKTRTLSNHDVGEKPHEDLDKKRLRNRLAQRAFRRRQADRLRTLLDRADSTDRPYDETIQTLQDENSHLRKNLIDVQTKLARLVATMQSLTGSVTDALEFSSHGNADLEQDEAALGPESDNKPEPEAKTKKMPSSDTSSSDVPKLDLDDFVNMDSFKDATLIPTKSLDHKEFDTPDVSIELSSPASKLAASFDSLAQQIPSIWSFEYQMGLDPYATAMAGSEESNAIIGRGWQESNSPFSDHINVLQRLMKGKIERTAPPTISLFYQEVLMVLALFNSMTRPDVMRWYAKTRFYHIVNLTVWQLYPCTKTFNAIHPQYRPTVLQLQSQYPKVIDWIPFPSIRDRLIQLHSANPQLDRIFCDAVSSYVVEAWMSDLISGAPMIRAYIRITDLIPNIDQSTPSHENRTLGVSLPAPDVTTLFSSSDYAQATFNLLNMDRGVSNYKIDPAFFATYPELYDQSAKINAEGIPLRPDFQPRLSYPTPLNNQTVQTYRNFIDFFYDWPSCVQNVRLESTFS